MTLFVNMNHPYYGVMDRVMLLPTDRVFLIKFLSWLAGYRKYLLKRTIQTRIQHQICFPLAETLLVLRIQSLLIVLYFYTLGPNFLTTIGVRLIEE